jgi:hypothetical protein
MRRFSALQAAAWSLTWAIGAGLGVAFGGYLTAVSSSATVGEAAIDPAELTVLPLAAAGLVFAVSFIGRLLVALVVRLAHTGPRDEPAANQDEAEHDRVGGVD